MNAPAMKTIVSHAAEPTIDSIRDAADDIECAVQTVNDLLRIAIDALVNVTGNKADVAIRSAKRYVDDIRVSAQWICSADIVPLSGCWAAVSDDRPDDERDVLAWHGPDQMPIPAFYDTEDKRWFSKIDGCEFEPGVVTHWQEIQVPEGCNAPVSKSTPLNEDEALVVHWFAMMDDRRQREAMRYMADIAVAFPRSIRAVSGGAK